MSYRAVAYSTTATIQNTQFFTDFVLDNKVPGVFVECGIAAGAQMAAMQERLIDRKEKRWIYGFDSFEGIPLASDEDDEQPGISGPKPVIQYTDKRELLKSSGITVCSKESVLANFRNWFPNDHDNIVLVKGWFQDTLKPYKTVLGRAGGIALLRLDGDLYDSTRVSLEELFPLLHKDGILIIDDWNLGGCRRACEEYFANVDVTMMETPYGTDAENPRYFIKN